MHGDQSTLEGVIERFVLGVCDREWTDDVKAFPEVRMPELVASRKSLECTLVDDKTFFERSVCSSHEITPPEAEAERTP